MKFATSTIILAAAVNVGAFQFLDPRGRIPIVASRQRTKLSSQDGSESADNSMGNVAVLEDVDGLGAAAAKTNLTASTVALDATEAIEDDIVQLIVDAEEEAARAAAEMMDEECEFDDESGGPKDELCIEGEEREGFRASLKKTIGNTLKMVRGMPTSEDNEIDADVTTISGDMLEQGWNQRGGTSSLRRNAEVWKFALKSVFRVLKPRSMRKKGASDAEIEKAQTEAAEFIRDGLLTLGPTFVKLGQVNFLDASLEVNSQTDVLLSCIFPGCVHSD